MIKNSIKKIFIKLARILGYELIDQNKFNSPTLDKNLDDNLSVLNKKSIVLPLGEVKITKKIKSLEIIFRTNTNIEIWDQNKKRLFEKPKIEYAIKSIKSLAKSISHFKKLEPNIDISLKILEDNSSKDNLKKLKTICKEYEVNFEVISHDRDRFRKIIKPQKTDDTYSNLSSLLTSFFIAKSSEKDLIFFLEDDYIHFNELILELVSTYERVSSQLEKDIFICPTDYPFLYSENEKTNLIIGSHRHWRTTNKTLCTFLTSKNFINKYWDNFYNNCLDRHDPFEKYLNEIYERETCISPVKSLSIHMANINSNYGLSPFINYKKLWDEN